MSLDDRLKEILDTLRNAPKHRAAGAIIDAEIAIKQVFTDEGYIKIPCVELEHDKNNNRPTLYTVMGNEVMTGQDWYERFIKEIDHERYEHTGNPTEVHNKLMVLVLEAAKRASGTPSEVYQGRDFSSTSDMWEEGKKAYPKAAPDLDRGYGE